MTHRLFFLLFFFVCCFTACGPDYLFSEKTEIPEAEWTYENILDYKIEISDTLQLYNLYLDIEHSAEFASQNIYIRIHTEFPSGEKMSKQIPIDFANKGGQWYGKCGGEWCNLRVVIQQGAFFNELGTYVFSFEQYLRVNPLPGIKSLAFRVEKTEAKRE